MSIKTVACLLLPIIIISACNTKTEEKPMQANAIPFFLGTYTDGDSEGIYQYTLYHNGSLKSIGLVARTENPSFLAYNTARNLLLAVNEIDNDNKGGISLFDVKQDSLILINTRNSGGAHPCHVTVNKDGFVLVSNYSAGTIGLLQIAGNTLSDVYDVQQFAGKGITARQEGPHAHSAWFNPYGSNIIAVDLGTDQLWFSELDTLSRKLIPYRQPKLHMGDGAGPRHLAIHPKYHWIYVINELNATISLVKLQQDGDYVIVNSYNTLPETFKGENTCADIKISGDGHFLYASNRGHNSIVIYKIDQEVGTLSLVGHEPTRGDGPRNFSLSPDGKFLLVANQHTNNIVSFRRNTTTGALTFADEIAAPTPVCILF